MGWRPMRWLLASAVAALGAAVAFWAAGEGEPPAPAVATRPLPERPAERPAAPAGPGVPAAAEGDAGGAPVNPGDAGPASPGGAVEVTVEVFGAKGHEVGATVSFHGAPTGNWRVYPLRDPDAELGESVGGGRTNVMGFTTLSLPVGRWRVRPPSEPAYVDVRPTTRELVLHLRRPNVVRGLVIDDKGEPVRRAVVEIRRHGFDDARGRWPGIHVSCGDDGRFAHSTFDASLTLAVYERGRERDRQFRKRINVPTPEVRLYLGSLTRVELTVTGLDNEPIAVLTEAMGVTQEEVVAGSTYVLFVVPGHVTFRARAVAGERRFYGAAEADVKPSESVRVPLSMAPGPPQRVHLVDPAQRPLASAQVILKNPIHTEAATSDAAGDAWFQPGVAPGRLGQVEVTGYCVDPPAFVSALDDEVTLVVTPCGALDAGQPGPGAPAPIGEPAR